MHMFKNSYYISNTVVRQIAQQFSSPLLVLSLFICGQSSYATIENLKILTNIWGKDTLDIKNPDISPGSYLTN